MEELEIRRNDSAFYVEQDGKRVAEMTYSRNREAGIVIIDHTQADVSLRGKGLPKKMVAAAVAWARAEKIKLMPLCPYAQHVFDTTPEFEDVRLR
jgi:predicted GNAT family acetyltransferase